MSWTRISALALRYTLLYKRSVPRMIELFFWPTMDLLVWGYVTLYLQRLYATAQSPSAGMGTITFLLGAMIFWDILYRAQQGVTLSFLEDVWTRNLLNVFVAPIRIEEFILATYLVGTVRIGVTVVALTGLAWLLYQFNLLAMGFALIPLFVNLLLMGWAMGMITTGLIMRWGQAVEALAWGVPFLVQPLAAVFYPVDVLPRWVQPISHALPATHVFEGMRQVLAGGHFPTAHLLWAFGLNAAYLVVAAWWFRRMYERAREKGLLAKLGTQ
ncbi:MAG: ABC transporter permease [Verrucomicrobiota bacterium]|nr:ABC transporter permease [Verrucomicrobiota bacterium]